MGQPGFRDDPTTFCPSTFQIGVAPSFPRCLREGGLAMLMVRLPGVRDDGLSTAIRSQLRRPLLWRRAGGPSFRAFCERVGCWMGTRDRRDVPHFSLAAPLTSAMPQLGLSQQLCSCAFLRVMASSNIFIRKDARFGVLQLQIAERAMAADTRP